MEELKNLITTFMQTVQTNMTVLNDSILNLKESIESKMSAIELKVDQNFVQLTDANVKLKEYVDKTNYES